MGEKYFIIKWAKTIKKLKDCQMVFTYMQRCSNSSVIKQRQMKLFQEVRT